jgi:hypothetical protein
MTVCGMSARVLFLFGMFSAGLAGSVPSASAEVLNVHGLDDSERIVATMLSVGPGYLLRRTYSISGGKEPTFTALEEESHYNGVKKELSGPFESIGTTPLRSEDVAGLDHYLTFLRMEYPGKCYATDTITVEYFRDDQLIGSESFKDETCVASWYTWKNGEVVVDGDKFRDFPTEALMGMRPFLLMEQRIWNERKQAEKES